MDKNITKQPKIIALKDLRLHAQSYINAVTKGESFVVVKRSRPAFRMEPIEDRWETIADFTGINPAGVPAEDVARVLAKLSAK